MEKAQNSGNILKYFSGINDPRIDRTKEHSLINIIVIAICAVVCGADSYTEIEDFGIAAKEWLKTFLDLKKGIPSHDTFGRVFSLIDPEEFKKCFLNWIKEVSQLTEGEIVSIDGKTLRRSYDKRSNKSAIHMISAWANVNGLVLGQVKVNDKSNEITAIPKLLKLLELKGCIVTIDAMGCQKNIANEIIDKGADYILALKGNQGKLFDATKNFFSKAEERNFEGISHENYVTEEYNHGRKEIREYRLVTDIHFLNTKEEWTELNSIGTVTSKRIIGEKETEEKRYYISSLSGGIKNFASGVRNHWGIENKLHWVLDVQFREDDSRIRLGNGAENFALLRHVALNLLRQDKTTKRGVKGKRFKASIDRKYREKIIFGI